MHSNKNNQISILSESEILWNNIKEDSFNFEHSLDSLYRKQTGSYYTDLELTLSMMQEMVASIPCKEKAHLYTKTFLEPCVGTGNFVFAYLRVCKNLNFTKSQYEKLLNNIYVCDINVKALEVYKKNLKAIAKSFFCIKLEDEYFGKHIGTGLIVDIKSKDIRYIPITDVFPKEIIKSGFDFVVTNPPYKNLKAEKGHYKSEEQYEYDKKKYISIGELVKKTFPYSFAGTLNLYKMFVEEIAEKYLANDGICSLLIPASILSDKTCSKLRTRLLESASIQSLKIISENSNYVDASQALCAMLFHKNSKTKKMYVNGAFSANGTNGNLVDVSDVIDKSTGNAILVLNKEEYLIRKKMREYPVIKNIKYINNLRGELDLTLNKKWITSLYTPYKLYRGRHIGYYYTAETDQVEYVQRDFVNAIAKRKYVHEPRIACQQIANMLKKRRISFAPIPPCSILGNSCNFISVQQNDDGVDNYFLLGILNSSLIDWYFKLTSSNNHINNYEIDNFPIPVEYAKKQEIVTLVTKYIETKNEQLLNKIDQLVYDAYGIPQRKEVINAGGCCNVR